MGCFSSKELVEADVARDAKGNIYNDETSISPEAEKAVNERVAQISGGSGLSKGSFSLHQSVTNRNVEALRAGSTNRGRRPSVGQDLNPIMDGQGMLNELVSRQLSHLSHYSVHSQNGAVMITPEDGNTLPFKIFKLIGRGGFGNVYLGEWTKQRVAIKVIQGYTNADRPEEAEWEARKERMAQMEAILMTAMNHPSIVNTLKVISQTGKSVDPEFAATEKKLLASSGVAPDENREDIPSFEWHIVMEFCDKGSLSRALSAFKFHEPVDANTLRWNAWATLTTLMEVVQALKFLHDNHILHGDLKAANVLLCSDKDDPRGWRSKVSDFGLSRVLEETRTHIKTQTFGTVTHMPPELLSKGTLSASADVYAVGVLMWEMFTSEKVFKQLSDSEVILSVVNKKLRPPFPSDVPSRYRFLAERCWAEMPELRPSLDQLMNELKNLMASLCPNGEMSEPIKVRVYPSRQKALAEAVQRAAREHYAAQQHSQPPGPPQPLSPPKVQPMPPNPPRNGPSPSQSPKSVVKPKPKAWGSAGSASAQLMVQSRLASATAAPSRLDSSDARMNSVTTKSAQRIQIDVDGRTRSFMAAPSKGEPSSSAFKPHQQ